MNDGKQRGRDKELEKIVEFAEERGVNIFDVINVYSTYKAINHVSGKDNAFDRTMEYIYKHS